MRGQTNADSAPKHEMPMRARIVTTLVAVSAIAMPTAHAQDRGVWVQPYALSDHTYVEFLRFETNPNVPARLRGERIDAVAKVVPSVEAGSRFALVVAFNLLIDEQGRGLQMVVAELTEARFAGADGAGVTLETRTSTELLQTFYECFDRGAVNYLHRYDVRWQLAELCANSVRWSAWQQLRFPAAGVLNLGRDRLPILFDYNRAKPSLTAVPQLTDLSAR